MQVSFNPYKTDLYQKQCLFQGNVATYTREFFLEVVNSNIPVKQKAKKLGLSLDTYYNRLRENGISHNKYKVIPPDIAADLKAEIQGYLNSGMFVSDICKRKQITESKYYRIVKELGIVNPRQVLHEKCNSISEKQFREVAASSLSLEEKCKVLDITKSTFFTLLKKYPTLTKTKKIIAHNSSISKEMFLEVANSSMSYAEKIKTLKISKSVYDARLSKYNILTDTMKKKQIIAKITKEDLESLIKQGLKVDDICNLLNINARAYSRLLSKFQIMTRNKITKRKIAEIDTKLFQDFLDNKVSKKHICKYFNINESMFYKLLKRYNLRYDYLHHSNEINISKNRLEELATSGMPIKKITQILGVGQNTYSEKAKIANVNTPLRKSIDTVQFAPVEEIKMDKQNGMTVKEICKKYNITETNYKSIIENNGFVTPYMESLRKNAVLATYSADINL